MTPAEEFAKKQIDGNKVVVFSKSYCPFCSKTKDTLREMGVEAAIFELNEMDDGSAIQGALLDITGQRTVPNVFVNGRHLGGNDSLQAAKKSGELQRMLANSS
jgi:glutaredoxin 3